MAGKQMYLIAVLLFSVLLVVGCDKRESDLDQVKERPANKAVKLDVTQTVKENVNQTVKLPVQ